MCDKQMILRKHWSEVQRAAKALRQDTSLIPREYQSEQKLLSLADIKEEEDDAGEKRFAIDSFVIYVATAAEARMLRLGSVPNETVIPTDAHYICVIFQ